MGGGGSLTYNDRILDTPLKSLVRITVRRIVNRESDSALSEEDISPPESSRNCVSVNQASGKQESDDGDNGECNYVYDLDGRRVSLHYDGHSIPIRYFNTSS